MASCSHPKLLSFPVICKALTDIIQALDDTCSPCSTSYSGANIAPVLFVYRGRLARGTGASVSRTCLLLLECPNVSSEKVLECVASAAM